MKMRTAMEGRVVAVMKLHDSVDGVITDLAHDAAFAHAMVMAMDEQQLIAYRLAVAAIKRRAAELMTEWKYTED
jgi:hypothetical protein